VQYKSSINLFLFISIQRETISLDRNKWNKNEMKLREEKMEYRINENFIYFLFYFLLTYLKK